MNVTSQLNFSQNNNLSYLELISHLEASLDIFGLFIAVCDDRLLREKIINQYEQELATKANCYQVKLDYREPSLKSAVNSLSVDNKLDINKPKVITVTGANNLSFVKHKQEQSEQEKFFGYLQWTRESLRSFSCPIILWVDNHILVNLSQQAPDFWSWRNAVIQFEAEARVTNNPNLTNIDLDQKLNQEHVSIDNSLSIADLEEIIAETEVKRGEKDTLLVGLYHRLGELYAARLQKGISPHYKDDLEKAKKSFCKAIELAKEFKLYSNLIISWNSLGLFYYYQANYDLAIDCYRNSLDYARSFEDSNDEAIALGNLGNVYYSLGECEKAIDYYKKSLTIKLKTGDISGTANALSGLGNVYYALKEHEKSIDYHQQSLAINKRIKNIYNEANALGNLGNVYYSLEEYEKAIDYYQQSLAINKKTKDIFNKANSLNNLGNIYISIGEYKKAINYIQESFAINKRIGNQKGVAISMFNLGEAWKELGQTAKAKQYYQNACQIFAAINLQSEVEECDRAIRNLDI